MVYLVFLDPLSIIGQHCQFHRIEDPLCHGILYRLPICQQMYLKYSEKIKMMQNFPVQNLTSPNLYYCIGIYCRSRFCLWMRHFAGKPAVVRFFAGI